MNKLKPLGYNANKFCDYAVETLKTLCDTGGNNSQVSFKLYEALTSSKVDVFDSEIRAYKAAVSTKDKTLDFTKLTTIAHAECMSIIMANDPLPPKLPLRKGVAMTL
eukprot:11046899-Ditylum_brightwellii.AAC.2